MSDRDLLARADSSGSRWVGVGHSTDPDPRTAGRAAARNALAGAQPKLLIVFSSHVYDLPRLLAGVGKEARDTPVIGCSTAAEIAPAGPATASVVVAAFGGSGFSVSTVAAANPPAPRRAAGEEVAAVLLDTDDKLPHRVALVLAADDEEAVDAACSALGAAVPLVGGHAGNGSTATAVYQLVHGEIRPNALVAAVLASEAPLGVGVRHGWRAIGEPAAVTRSKSGRVYTLDDRPALEVYLERLGAPTEVSADAGAILRLSRTHPLGLGGPGTEESARFVADASLEDGSLDLGTDVPHGALVWFLEGDLRSVLDATDEACSEAIAALDGRPPLGVVAFESVGRRLVLGEIGIRHAVQRLAAHADGAPLAGFYSRGEITRSRVTESLHNEALVVLAIA